MGIFDRFKAKSDPDVVAAERRAYNEEKAIVKLENKNQAMRNAAARGKLKARGGGGNSGAIFQKLGTGIFNAAEYLSKTICYTNSTYTLPTTPIPQVTTTVPAPMPTGIGDNNTGMGDTMGTIDQIGNGSISNITSIGDNVSSQISSYNYSTHKLVAT